MSKIYDALQKATRGEGPQPEPVQEQEVRPGPQLAESEVEAVSSVEFGPELVQLRANIDRMMDNSGSRVLLFTGAVPGEGASTIASRFAQLLATDPEHRVLLMDTDLRNRDPRTVEAVQSQDGFTSLLEGRVNLEDAVRSVSTGTLNVIPSEGVHADPYRVGSSNSVNRLVDQVRGSYHRVILDAAPVLTAPETAIMAGQVDGVVVVVRSGTTKREVIQRAIENLRKYDARVLGVVMNRQKYIIPSIIYKRL